MTRRRLIVAVTVLAAGVLPGWLLTGRLSPTEQRLIGTWRLRQKQSFLAVTFMADHRCLRSASYAWGIDETPGRWWVHGETVFMDLEPSLVRRTLRPLLEYLGIPVMPTGSCAVSEFDLDGTEERGASWTRGRRD